MGFVSIKRLVKNVPCHVMAPILNPRDSLILVEGFDPSSRISVLLSGKDSSSIILCVFKFG